MKPNTLPINNILDDVRLQLSQRNELVLQASPGAGKTTLVPLALLNEPWLQNQKILMLEPRRMAARTSAERMASLLDEKVGETVGYRIRQENKLSTKTRIEVITEGVLTRMLQDDPELKGIALIIFDEFHERNLNTDLGLALSLQARELFREVNQPLKLLVMSATLELSSVAQLLGDAPQINCEGRMFPVEIRYGQSIKTNDSCVEPIINTIGQALTETPGSILVFLPGQSEIRQVQKALSRRVEKGVCILPLYGALPLSAQMQAIAPLNKKSGYNRKIVLATDIAETSITIDDISTVIDSGLSRQPRFDPVTGMTRLYTRRVSQASSIQRMGRAGRTQQGYCYRLWSESAQITLEKQTPPEILQADLCPLALQLMQWGISDSSELLWLDQPPSAAFNQALDLLYTLGATRQDPRETRQVTLTDHGMQMASIATHPRLAHMLIRSIEFDQLKTATALATLLSDKDPLVQYGSDISSKVAVLMGEIPCENRFTAWFKRCQQQMVKFEKQCRNVRVTSTHSIDAPDIIGMLLSLAYPDRIAQRRQQQSQDRKSKPGIRYLLSNGRAARLHENDPLAKHDYLAIAEIGGHANQREDSIYSACSLNPSLFDSHLLPLVSDHEQVSWDDASGRLLGEKQKRIVSLIIHRQPLQDIALDKKKQALLNLVRNKGLGLLPWTESARQWCARIQCLREYFDRENNNDWPDVSEKNLMNTLEHWLSPYLDNINKIEDFKRLDLQACLSQLLPWPLPRQLDELAPLSFKVPSGSNIKINYMHNPPVLAVKLQEMFGCQSTPAIAHGKIKLLVHLLSPAQKPLQITQDLEGFWKGSYEQVKKEMKGRYPKHPWPDNPLQALATRYTKKNMAKHEGG